MNELTVAQAAELKGLLERRKRDLVREIESKLAEAKTERVAPDAVSTTDGGDKALLEAASGLDLAIVRRDIEELRTVEQALRRIADGTIGECPDCGNAIAPERLRAYPAAARCAACQAEFERRSGIAQPAKL